MEIVVVIVIVGGWDRDTEAGSPEGFEEAEQHKGSFLTDSSPMESSQRFLLRGVGTGRCLPE